MLKFLPKILHKRGGRGVVALRFCTFVVGFIGKAWFYSLYLELAFPHRASSALFACPGGFI